MASWLGGGGAGRARGVGGVGGFRDEPPPYHDGLLEFAYGMVSGRGSGFHGVGDGGGSSARSPAAGRDAMVDSSCQGCSTVATKKKPRTTENVMRLLALREVVPLARRPKRRLWGGGGSGGGGGGSSGCCRPSSQTVDARHGLTLWLEADSLRRFTARYCTLRPAPRSTIAAAFSLDGNSLASTHGDHTVKIICCHTGQCLKVLTGHRRTPWVVRFHPRSSQVLASGSLDHEVRLWDANSAECIASNDFFRPIASLAFHAQGDLLAVASGHKLYIWQYTKEGDAAAPVIVLRTKRSLRAVHFHPQGGPLLLTAEVNDLNSTDCPPTIATSRGYLSYPPPTIHFSPAVAAMPSAATAVPPAAPPPLFPFASLLWPSLGPAPAAAAAAAEAPRQQANHDGSSQQQPMAAGAYPLYAPQPRRLGITVPLPPAMEPGADDLMDVSPRLTASTRMQQRIALALRRQLRRATLGPAASSDAAERAAMIPDDAGAGPSDLHALGRSASGGHLQLRGAGRQSPTLAWDYAEQVLEDGTAGPEVGPLSPWSRRDTPPGGGPWHSSGSDPAAEDVEAMAVQASTQDMAAELSMRSDGGSDAAAAPPAAPVLQRQQQQQQLAIAPPARHYSGWELPYWQGWFHSQPWSQGGSAAQVYVAALPEQQPNAGGRSSERDGGAGMVGVAGAGIGAQIGAAAGVNAAMQWDAQQGNGGAVGGMGVLPSIGPAEAAAAQAAMAAAAAAELPCTVKLRLWPHYIKRPSAQLDPDTCRLTIPHAVLCSEMGTHFSPCGRFLAACVACVPQPSEPDGWQPLRFASAALAAQHGSQSPTAAAGPQLVHSPTQHPANTQQVIYELRVYSLEESTFGQVLASRAVRAAHCLTSIQFSPSSSHILLAYGRRHSSLLRSLVADGTSIIPIYTILEVYRVSDMALVRVLPSAEDEVNVACFHPRVGGGLLYGTKEGKVRILQHDRSPRHLNTRRGLEDELLEAEMSEPLNFGIVNSSEAML
eukprot:SM000107S14068  [mRNA]  locus=s107:376089:382541:+ [translate_table: standard]